MTTAAELFVALNLPAGTRVDQRVPKKLLFENGAPTAADRRMISEGIESIQWLAAIKPATTGVPAYRDAVREYIEIAVVRAEWRDGAKFSRLTELVHRAIPYPVVLLSEQGGDAILSLAPKRWAQNEAAKVVLDGEIVTVKLADLSAEIGSAFLRALPLEMQPRGSMLTLYGGWENCLFALQAATLTGKFVLLDSDERIAARRMALNAVVALRDRIEDLRHAATTVSQMARQVEINLELKRLQVELTAAQEQL